MVKKKLAQSELSQPQIDGPQTDRPETDRPQSDWQVVTSTQPSDDWVNTVEQMTGLSDPVWGAQLLWNRGLRSAAGLRGFLRTSEYEPASPFEFGEEMTWAVERLVKARDRHEKVAIWGDFDADGVTSTAVLWDGLRQFFTGSEQLSYFIPNRLKESHGLSIMGIDELAAQGVDLIVTCDTGSTNPKEIERAGALGMEVIVTDHHTLPETRPAVVAIVNPRALPHEHPMAHLSGVAVAYKLIEALYERLPGVPTRPLSELVDLVAIGLIADLVELTGDCRYLAQLGIAQLQTHLKAKQPVRPGVAKLLKLCKRAGDRPTDISFGIGPRINAVSRIYGDARFCVELLTSQDEDRCQELASKAELANTRRKALQNDVFQQVTQQLENADLSTLGVIVLCDLQWPVGVLGLVAGQVAQQYGRPTILLTLDSPDANGKVLARGSARSVNRIDLYELMKSQAHMLTGFGGHPFAAGLSLPAEDLPLFTTAINQQHRQQRGQSQPMMAIDLAVTVADLGQDLFRQLKLLEPCGMGNPVPKLLIKNCWFEDVWHQKLKDRTGSKVGYIKATFQLCDHSGARFPGLWWGHYKDDLPPGMWDAIAELDYNSYSSRYEVRLVDIRSVAGLRAPEPKADVDWLLDRRLGLSQTLAEVSANQTDQTNLVLSDCPTQWQELWLWRQQANSKNKPLALAYAPPVERDPIEKWKTLLGLAKFVSREQVAVTKERLGSVLGVCDRTLTLGLAALEKANFAVKQSAVDIRLDYRPAKENLDEPSRDPMLHNEPATNKALGQFLAAVQEEQFRRQYFYQTPVSTLEATINAKTL
ncbi:MAG: single-stranded-DNA-specific exonuclease RecJ [Phormidesmis sp.]